MMMGRTCLILAVVGVGVGFGPSAHGQQPAPTSSAETAAAPLPDTRQLVLDVERNAKAAEAIRKNYTYHVHFEQQELDGKGALKKTTSVDSESVTVDTVRVNRATARNGKALTPEEVGKENDRIDKEVDRDKARRGKKEDKGQDTDSRGDEVISAARILELGTFTNPRRVELNGRSTIVLDYAGDPNAKTHSAPENAIRDLVGTVWIDEANRVLVQAEGHFLKDFKIGGGLVADIRKDSGLSAHWARINDEVWLPTVIDGNGKIRVLLVAGFSGRIHLVTSDYRKFRTSATIVSGGNQVDADGNPVPERKAGDKGKSVEGKEGVPKL